ncbi:hypothetical protein [Flavobacterium undicola]|uniref:hypothetical protein n=1 Tax=Flavobacterium undicola TaxID=1932779 RepID=UPI0013783901|nr:hypothetical protein [Flavobacterium undicola]MBA0883669.1 hypothetical protein [Flavobacterium undicola]
MEIETDINRNLSDSGCDINSGRIIIFDNKIVKFIQNEEQEHNQSLLDIQDIKIIKSNKATYEVEYINRHDIYQNKYNAKITITNGSSFYVKLNFIERLKIKWMIKNHWIQKGNNITIVITLVIAIISTIIAYLNYIK